MAANSLQQPDGNLARDIQGIWILKSRVDVDGNGRMVPDPYMGDEPVGIVCFGTGHFAAQFMKRDRSGEEITTHRAQSRNNSAGVNGYDAYFGTYRVDETAGTMTTRIDGSIVSVNMGNEYTRDIRVSENTLIIRLNTTAVDGTEITRTNTFTRAS